jgi:hypothetical protein
VRSQADFGADAVRCGGGFTIADDGQAIRSIAARLGRHGSRRAVAGGVQSALSGAGEVEVRLGRGDGFGGCLVGGGVEVVGYCVSVAG